MGKVVIIGGNKRAGKTTLSLLLHKKYNYNYVNFDSLLDSLENTFSELDDGDNNKYIKLLEEMVKRAIDDSNNYGVSTVFDYIFTPEKLSNFEYKNLVQIYILANLDANEENIKDDLINYSEAYDWPLTATEDDLERNIKYILVNNEKLIKDAKEYKFKLINTSRGKERNQILERIAKEIVED